MVAPTISASNFDSSGRLKHPNQHHTNVIPRVATKPPVGISQNARGVLRGMFAPNFYEAKVTLCQTSWDKTRYRTTPSASCLGRDPYGRLCCRPLDDVNKAVVGSLQESFLQRQLPHKSKFEAPPVGATGGRPWHDKSRTYIPSMANPFPKSFWKGCKKVAPPIGCHLFCV